VDNFGEGLINFISFKWHC